MAKTPSEKNWPLYLRILSYLKPYYKHIILVIFFNFGFVVTSALSVWMIAPVISVFFEQAAHPGTQAVQEPPPADTGDSGDSGDTGSLVVRAAAITGASIAMIQPSSLLIPRAHAGLAPAPAWPACAARRCAGARCSGRSCAGSRRA